MTRIGLVYSRMRPEEKLFVEAAERLGVELVPVWDGELVLDVHAAPAWAQDLDAVLVRTLGLHRALAVAATLERHGVPTLNGHGTLATCGDKWLTSLVLARAGVPTPPTLVATDGAAATRAAETLGYPVVTKPLEGSWARMVARLADRDALEAVVEAREVLGHPGHHLHYLQTFVDKPGRDIRAFVVGDRTLCAIHRTAEHWITNTARGATASKCTVTDELDTLCVEAARAVGGGVLAVDLMESPDGLVVHEVNATMEFRNSIAPTGVDIPAAVLGHVAGLVEVVP